MNRIVGLDNTAEVLALDYEGRGVARVDGKTVFIKGALPLEKVVFRITRSKKQFDEAETVRVLKASSQRTVPVCCYFDTCGGCVLQYASAEAQVAFKQRILEEQLLRIGGVFPERLLPPIYGMPYAYRQRARLSIAVDGKGRLKLGFRARRSNEVVDIDSCSVLPVHVSAVLSDVRSLLQEFVNINERISHIEFSVGERLTVLNVCMQGSLSEKARGMLHRFSDGLNQAETHQWQVWVQQGKNAPYPFGPDDAVRLTYDLPEFGVSMPYKPGDFTQINAQMNALMVGRALHLLDIRKGERVADLFCGLGNFSIPMAKLGAKVVGIEGADYLVRRAAANAGLNGCADIVFQTADLFKADAAAVAAWGRFDKMLLDPPRSGAYAVVQALHKPYLPKRIVYVSCNPASFARDAAVLVEKGYCFKAAGVMNLFPHTAHVESIGWFELH